ncbi:MAG TPA: sulfurtransferase [Firmicutes bacterium]|nr:sulfurtransferase [Bacillota bacterium]
MVLLGCNADAGRTRGSRGRKIAPVVSTEWLAKNIKLENLVKLDVRPADMYESGHLPGAVNAPVDRWITERDGLLLEVPEKEELFSLIGACGMTPASIVVLVSSLPGPGEPPYPLADCNRVADTLIYAGIKNVAVLDGGYDKWAAEGREVTTDVPEIKAVAYDGKINRDIFVSRDYVKNRIGKAVIADCRDTEVYTGEIIEPYANKAGHIPSAKSLPAPAIWNENGLYKDVEELRKMASAVIDSKDKEVIVYCGVGGYASSWWYVLTQMLGYDNVKFYDGSAQEWVRENDMTLD